MEKVQCINLHWFDAEKYTLCPICGAVKSGEDKAARSAYALKAEPEKKKIGQILFSKRKTETSGIPKSTIEIEPPVNGFSLTQRPTSQIPVSRTEESSNILKTELLIKPRNSQAEIKPVQFYNQEICYLFSEEDKVPVVAWLVGINGTRTGRSYVVKPGVNLLLNTFNKGPTITYEVGTRKFYIDGEESEIYCNGFRVGSKRELCAYDVIELDNEKYRFVPFCGPNFDWSSINN